MSKAAWKVKNCTSSRVVRRPVRCRFKTLKARITARSPEGTTGGQEKKDAGEEIVRSPPPRGRLSLPYLFLAVFLAAFFAGFFADFLALFLALFFAVFFTATITPPSHLIELNSCKIIVLRGALVKTFVHVIEKFLHGAVRRIRALPGCPQAPCRVTEHVFDGKTRGFRVSPALPRLPPHGLTVRAFPRGRREGARHYRARPRLRVPRRLCARPGSQNPPGTSAQNPPGTSAQNPPGTSAPSREALPAQRTPRGLRGRPARPARRPSWARPGSRIPQMPSHRQA
jgi:hypothetical protein